ncbi:ABC transporter substrate-binding protein [Gordonia phthalatica]|uniref:Leucine-binding protein domain-containing protein n=1 Tax=Gordonia phthalatica TaxID=1136941 RepID=A0A0N7FV44_9ACTN|nr:ABC transporter substrate-binding protein [Gordonia phthalatica]ALG86127.1 hypothetical protein ACH46_18555 [Gordonia phthalatica]
MKRERAQHVFRRLLGLTSIALASITAVSACALPSSVDDGKLTIGLVTSQTGPASQLGIGELQGARLAIDEINKNGGVNGKAVELITADDQSNPSQTVLQVRKMLGRVDGIVGPSTSGPCKAIQELVATAKIVDYCLSPGVRPKSDGWQWSASVSTEDLAVALVEYWKAQGITKIGLLSSTDSSGSDGAKAVKAAIAGEPGMVLTAASTFIPDAVSVTAQLGQIARTAPQGLVVWATGAGAGVAFQGLRLVGLHVPVATTDGNLTHAFVDRIKAFLPDPLLIPATRDFWAPEALPSDEVRTIEETYHGDYQAAFNELPDFGPGVAYDGVRLLVEALRRANGDSEKARTELEGIKDFPGVVGNYQFSPGDRRGLTRKDVGVVKVTTDGFEFVGGQQ